LSYKAKALIAIIILAFTPVYVTATAGQTLTKDEWVQQMNELKTTPGVGCFAAAYPSHSWVKVSCGNSTDLGPFNVGGGGLDWFDNSVFPSPAITSTTGAVTTMTGFSTESDTVKGANFYSIQLNTNFFSTTYNGYTVTGWQQFVFANQPYIFGCCGYILMEYWLIGYYSQHGNCPSGWSVAGGSCTLLTPSNNYGVEWPQYLNKYTFSGFVTSTTDTAQFCDANKGTCGQQTYNDILGLVNNARWVYSEWNVLGYTGGSGAIFNSGGGTISLTVRVSSALTTATCSKLYDNAGEYNNLNLGTCSASGNAVTFTENK
jgi:hypothetical protein